MKINQETLISNESIIIKSIPHKNKFYIPIGLWAFAMLIASSIYIDDDEHIDNMYHLGLFTLHSLWITGLLIFLAFLFSKKVEITTTKIIYRNFFNRITKEYKLDDIVDFYWSNKPIVRRNRTGDTTTRLVLIGIDFKNGESISMSGDQFANYNEIRSWLFDYCTDNEIITIRPLEERKRSRFRL